MSGVFLEGRTSVKRVGFVSLRAVAIGVLAAAAFAVPVLATGTWHPISGTVPEYWSVNNGWYVSSNYRYVSAGGSAIKVQFSHVPSHGMAFKCINVNTNQQIGIIVYSPPLTTQQIAGTQKANVLFVNSFRHQISGAESNHDYTFDGSEYY
jgi:hypothetical protein